MVKLKMLGLELAGAITFVLLLIGLIFLSLYILSCIVLYAFVELTGYLEFSWENGLWTMILLITAKYIFGSHVSQKKIVKEKSEPKISYYQ